MQISKLYAIVFCILALQTNAQPETDQAQHAPATFICKEDFFGNIHIDVIPFKTGIKELTKQIQRHIKKHKNRHKNKAFLLNIAHEYGMHNQSAKDAGFTMHYADNQKTQWIFRNGSGMPHSATAIASTSVFIFRMNNDAQELLLIKDLDKQHLELPGGCIEPFELAIDGAVREVKEETGLSLTRAQISFIALSDDAHTCFYDRAQYRFFFTATYPGGTIKLDPKEQEFYLWVPVGKLMTGLRIEGYEVEKIIFTLLSSALHNKQQLEQLIIPKQELSYNKLDTTESITLWKIR